jgi:hypothetical protein
MPVSLSAANRLVYIYQEITIDDSDPYWLVEATHPKHRREPQASERTEQAA